MKNKKSGQYVHKATGANRKQRRDADKDKYSLMIQVAKKIEPFMTPTSSNIIIKSALDQKQAFSFKKEDGSIMSLNFVPNRHHYETNGLVTNPVLAQVIVPNPKFPHIQMQDWIVLHHNIIFNKAMTIHTDEQEQYRLQAIPVDRWIMGKIVDGEVAPFPDNIVCKRISAVDVDPMFIVPDIIANKTLPDRCTVLSAPEGSMFKPEDVVVIKKWADYEVIYIWEGEEKRRVIVWKEDIEMIM